MAEEGFFLGLGPWPFVDINMDLLVFYPPQFYIYLSDFYDKFFK